MLLTKGEVKTMRVKGFAESSMDKLEEVINRWLEDNADVNVIDIRYDFGRGVVNIFSALFFYKHK